MIVAVQFQRPTLMHSQDSRVYNYQTDHICSVGDMAVVETNGLLKIVEIIEVPAKREFKGPLKWLVDVVDMNSYLKHLEIVDMNSYLKHLEK